MYCSTPYQKEIECDYDQLTISLKQVISELRDHPLAKSFIEPINESQAPGYSAIVKYPMGEWVILYCTYDTIIAMGVSVCVHSLFRDGTGNSICVWVKESEGLFGQVPLYYY